MGGQSGGRELKAKKLIQSGFKSGFKFKREEKWGGERKERKKERESPITEGGIEYGVELI